MNTTAPVDAITRAKAAQDERQRRIEEVRRGLDILHPEPNSAFELRFLGFGNKKDSTASGYFIDRQKAAETAVKFDDANKPSGMYVTINRVNPRLHDRAPDEIVPYLKPVTSDTDIERRQSLLIDCDPARPADTCSTDEEHRASMTLGAECEDFLTSQGWPLPIHGDSGNGCHLIYKIDLPNDAESKALVEAVLKGLSHHFGSQFCDMSKPQAHVDVTTFNAARIGRLFGTMNRKGRNSTKWRRSQLFNPPEDFRAVSVELLQKIAALAPAPERNGHQASTSNGHALNGEFKHRLLVDRWLNDHNRQFAIKQSSEGTLYILGECPFDPSHGDHREVHIGQEPGGKLSAKCKHNSCAGRGWQEFKAAIGKPDANHYDPPLTGKSNGQSSDRPYGSYAAEKPAGNVEPGTEAAAVEGFAFRPITSRELATGDFSIKCIIDGVIPHGQGGVVSAQFKKLKTATMVDACLSAATATPFLNRFEVPRAVSTCLMSAEIGFASLKERALSIARAKGIELADVELMHWADEIPMIGNIQYMDALANLIDEKKLELLVIDPSYLAFCEVAESASNVFAMGGLLRTITKLIQQTGCTIVIVNHNTKGRGKDIGQYDPPQLGEVAMSGFAEWARFWLLLAGRREWDDTIGQHWQWLRTGGSGIDSDLWAMDVTEGRQSDPGGRRWEVAITTPPEAKREAEQDRERRKAGIRERAEQEHERKLLAALALHPEGETVRVLSDESGLNKKDLAAAIQSLLKTGRAESCSVKKRNVEHDGYRPKN